VNLTFYLNTVISDFKNYVLFIYYYLLTKLIINGLLIFQCFMVFIVFILFALNCIHFLGFVSIDLNFFLYTFKNILLFDSGSDPSSDPNNGSGSSGSTNPGPNPSGPNNGGPNNGGSNIKKISIFSLLNPEVDSSDRRNPETTNTTSSSVVSHASLNPNSAVNETNNSIAQEGTNDSPFARLLSKLEQQNTHKVLNRRGEYVKTSWNVYSDNWPPNLRLTEGEIQQLHNIALDSDSGYVLKGSPERNSSLYIQYKTPHIIRDSQQPQVPGLKYALYTNDETMVKILPHNHVVTLVKNQR